MAKKQRIGILSDSFDPIHIGDIRLGLNVLNAGLIDHLLVMPAHSSQDSTCGADPEDRWKMLVSSCSCDDRLIPSRLELDRRGTSCTAETLTLLKKQHPGASLYYLIGSDALINLSGSYQYHDFISLCSFLIYPRKAEEDQVRLRTETECLAAAGVTFQILRFDPPPVSSAAIRDTLSLGRIPSGLDPSVLEYCLCKGLYGYPRRFEQAVSWIDGLFASLKPKRFAHTLSVAFTSRCLAEKHGLDPVKAEQAGLLHDCAKCLSLEEMQRIAVENNLTDDRTILERSALLHSLVGAWVAEHRYGMSDPDVLDAIRYHNTGFAGMSRLAMCVCLADSIEPLRERYPLLDEVRELSSVSIERSLLLSLQGTAGYVTARGKYLHPRTQNTIRWLKQLTAENNSL